MNKRKLTLSYSFIGVLGIFLLYIGGLGALIKFISGLCFYTLLAYFISCIWRFFLRKKRNSLWDFSVYFLYKLSGSLGVFIIIVIGFTVYQNIINPAMLPLHTLTNGEKIIRFQTMSHVASSDFYAQVQKEILTAKQDGFVLFFEGVRPGSEESGDAFNKALGIEFNPELYNNFSKLYGIVAQNNDDFLRIVNDKDYNVDLSLDEVMDIYDRKQELSKAVGEQTDTPKTQALDINSELIRTLSSLSEKQLLLLRFLNQSFMNFMMKNEALRDTLITKIGNTDIFAVILDDRNEYLVEEILNSEHDKVHILYGLMHFKGVLDILQSRDPRWRIIETQSYQVVSQSS